MLAGPIVLAASCSKALEETPAAEGTEVTRFSFDLYETRTAYNQEDGVYKLVWSEGDCITVNGVKSEPVPASFVGTRSAEFTVPGLLTAPFNILYGAKDGSDDAVVFPYRQTSACEGNAPMYAVSENTVLTTFTGLFASVRMTVKGADDAIQTIALHAKGDENISGDFTVGKTDGKFDGTLSASGNNSSWTALSCGASELTSEGTEYIVNIPVGVYSQGFEAFITTSSAKVMRVSFLGSGKTVTANRMYALPEISFEANSDIYVIATEEDLVSLKMLEGSPTKNNTVKAQLVADLDMTGVEYTAVTNYYGSFDGLDHEIKGLTTSLFGNLYGPVRNLTIESNIVYAGKNDACQAGTDYGLGILCHYVYATGSDSYVTNAAVENVTVKGSVSMTAPTDKAHAFQMGGLSGASNGVPFSNCVNKADVTLADGYSVAAHSSGSTAYVVYVGGVLGTSQSNASSSLTNCRNEGTVTFAASSVGETSGAGGIVGYVANKAPVTGCTNAGNVLTTSQDLKAIHYIGGVVGNNNKTCVLTDCENTSEVKFAGTGTSWMSVGGVCGNSMNGCSNDVNRGAVIASDCSATYVFVGGVTCTIDGDSNSNLYNYGPVTMTNVKHTASTGIAIGGVAAKCNTGNLTYSGLENHGDVTVNALTSGSTAGRYDIGGVIAYLQYEKVAASATVNFNDFVNTGDIVVNSISTSNNVRVGGIIGNALHHVASNTSRTNHDLNLSSCRNEGAITITAGANKTVQVGGLVGDTRVSGTLTVTNGSNTGDIEVKGIAGEIANTNGGLCMGGIVGKAFCNYCAAVGISGTTNSGRLYLNEDTANDGTDKSDSGRPCVGGILGLAAASSGKTTDVTISNCTNNGGIHRTRTNAAYQKLDYNTNEKTSCGGGIVGSLGFFHTGGMDYSYVNAIIENCVNNGEISFSRKRNLTYTSSTEKNTDGTGNYNGGILGLGMSSTTDGIVVRSCVNNGPVKSTAGKDGGIVGFMRRGVHITGTASAYTENRGQVHHQGASVSENRGTPVGYCGGIAGYMFGDPTNTIEYAANYGFLASNYGAGGIVGLFGTSSYPSVGTVSHCKVYCESHASSTADALVNGGKTALIFGDLSSSTAAAFSTVSDIAVGGAVYKYIDAVWSKIDITADNFNTYLSALKYTLTPEEAAASNVVYWDGTSKTSWE